MLDNQGNLIGIEDMAVGVFNKLAAAKDGTYAPTLNSLDLSGLTDLKNQGLLMVKLM